MADLQVTKASEWGGDETEVVELPSGKVAKLKKRIAAVALVRHGALDLDHLEVLEEIAKAAEEERPVEGINPKVALEANDRLVREMFVEPRISLNGDDPADDTIHIDQLAEDDLQFVTNRALGVVEDAASFRAERDRAADGADGEGVGDDAVKPGGAAEDKPGGVGAGSRSGGQARKPAGKRTGARAKK